MRQYYAYILASHAKSLYTGITNNIVRRVYEHRTGQGDFSSRYHIHRLVYYEVFARPMDAIRREKAVKRMRRRVKIKLIEKHNPMWLDLAAGWFDTPDPLCRDSE